MLGHEQIIFKLPPTNTLLIKRVVSNTQYSGSIPGKHVTNNGRLRDAQNVYTCTILTLANSSMNKSYLLVL